jgi:hypothetical protein
MIKIHNLPDKPKRYIVAQYVARDVGGEVFDRGEEDE